MVWVSLRLGVVRKDSSYRSPGWTGLVVEVDWNVGRGNGLVSRVYRLNGSVPYTEYRPDWSSVTSWVGRRGGLSSRVSHQSGQSSWVSHRNRL